MFLELKISKDYVEKKSLSTLPVAGIAPVQYNKYVSFLSMIKLKLSETLFIEINFNSI